MKNIFFLITVVVIFSCKGDKKHVAAYAPLNKEDSISKVIAYKLKNEPKLFLKFWAGMNIDEWSAVRDTLIKEGVIDNDKYITPYGKALIEYNFERHILTRIQLSESPKDIYPIYQKKYNLPSLIKSSQLRSEYVENNPEYDPKRVVNTDSGIVLLPDYFTDNSEFLKDNEQRSLPLKGDSSEEIIPESEIIIQNNNNVIEIKQEIQEDPLPYYQYSLSNRKDIERYSRSKEGEKVFGKGLFGKGGNLIAENSKLRYVAKSKHPIMHITYMTPTDYKKKNKSERMKLKRSNDNRYNKQIETKKLEKRVYDEI